MFTYLTMNFWFLFTVIFVSSLMLCTEAKIQELDPHSLSLLKSASKSTHATYLILFYAPWCGACQHFKPVYKEAAKVLPKEFSGLHFSEIDADKYKTNLTEYHIKSYPTLIVLSEGSFAKFSSSQAIKNFDKLVKIAKGE